MIFFFFFLKGGGGGGGGGGGSGRLRFSGAAAPCSGVQGMYKLHAAAFATILVQQTTESPP